MSLGKGITIINGFDLKSSQPVDGKSVCETLTEMQELITDGYISVGQICYCKETTLYYTAELDDTSILVWNESMFEIEVNPSVPSGTTTTAITGLRLGTEYFTISGSGSGTSTSESGVEIITLDLSSMTLTTDQLSTLTTNFGDKVVYASLAIGDNEVVIPIDNYNGSEYVGTYIGNDDTTQVSINATTGVATLSSTNLQRLITSEQLSNDTSVSLSSPNIKAGSVLLIAGANIILAGANVNFIDDLSGIFYVYVVSISSSAISLLVIDSSGNATSTTDTTGTITAYTSTASAIASLTIIY